MKNILFSFLSLPLLIGSLSSSEENTISALSASYEDSNLVLHGEVKLFHGLGTLCAEKASLYKQENNKDLPFSQVNLQDQVQIFCKNDSTLTCDIANLNFETLQGEILSKGLSPVLYTGKILQNGEGVPIQIKGKSLALIFDKKGDDYSCKEMTAKENVTLHYAKEFVLQSDEACYKKTASSPSLNGTITAYPTSTDSYCHLYYLEKTIQSSFIEVLMDESRLRLTNPKGSIPSSIFSEKQQGELFFTCKDLYWDHGEGILTLQEQVQIQETHLGNLAAEKIVKIQQHKENNSTTLKSMDVQGKSILSHADYKLTSYGKLHLDGLKGRITVTSPKTKGKPTPEEQILFENSDMQLRSDSAFLEYTEPTHELSALTFGGNVRIQSLDNATAARCALADKLVYAPDTKTIILSANPGKKVLFWDEEQGITLSAKEVHLTQNPETNKTEIKGIGNMKLSLSQEEEKILKNNFSLFPNPKESHVE